MATFDDEYFMNEALKEARMALDENEVPIGAVVVCNNKIVGKGHNLTERLSDVTAHAEMLALTAATQALGGKYLNDCTLYVTVEPCVMCAGALAWAQLGRLVYGTSDEKRGFARCQPSLLHPKTTVSKGILEEACKKLVVDFFKHKR
jgi:tRNA(adenine34) deaminase